jgi:hypothetical protein
VLRINFGWISWTRMENSKCYAKRDGTPSTRNEFRARADGREHGHSHRRMLP